MATMVVNYAQFKASLATLVGAVVYYAAKQPGFIAVANLGNGDSLVYQSDVPPDNFAVDYPMAVQVQSLTI